MKLSIQEGSDRVRDLLSDIKSKQQLIDQHQRQFAKSNALAKSAIDHALETAPGGPFQTIDQLARACLAELPEDQRQKALKDLNDVKPPQGIIDSMKDPLTATLECAKFLSVMFTWYQYRQYGQAAASVDLYMSRVGVAYYKAAEANVIARGIAETSIASIQQKLGANEIAQAEAEAEINSIKAFQNAHRLDSALTYGEEEARVASVAEMKQLQAEVGAVEDIVTVVRTDSAIAMRGAIRAGLWGIAAGLVIWGAGKAYEIYQEHKAAEKLQEVINNLATARLYASVDELSAADLQSQPYILKEIAEEYLKDANHQTNELQKKLKDYIELTKSAQPENLVDGCAKDLNDLDNGRNTADDPSLQQMKDIHAAKIQELRKKAALSGPPIVNPNSGMVAIDR